MTGALPPLAAVGGKTLWYLTRGTGVVTLLLLTASMVLGVLNSVRWESGRWPRFVTAALHRNVSLLVVVFLLAHIATTVLDGFVPIGWVDAVVPFTASYRPIWLGLGTVAFDLLLALTITSLLRERVGQKLWRTIHWAAYACWPVAIVHGLGTGFDAREGWMLGVDALCVTAVLVAVGWRIVRAEPSAAWMRLAAGSLALAVPLGMAGFAVQGPLRADWQRKAVTKTASFNGASGAVQGTVTQRPIAGGWVDEVIELTASGPGAPHLTVSLRGRRLTGGGLGSPAGSLSAGTAPGVVTASGTITGLTPGAISATAVRAADGSTWSITLHLTVDHTAGTARGTVTSAEVRAARSGS